MSFIKKVTATVALASLLSTGVYAEEDVKPVPEPIAEATIAETTEEPSPVAETETSVAETETSEEPNSKDFKNETCLACLGGNYPSLHCTKSETTCFKYSFDCSKTDMGLYLKQEKCDATSASNKTASFNITDHFDSSESFTLLADSTLAIKVSSEIVDSEELTLRIKEGEVEKDSDGHDHGDGHDEEKKQPALKIFYVVSEVTTADYGNFRSLKTVEVGEAFDVTKFESNISSFYVIVQNTGAKDVTVAVVPQGPEEEGINLVAYKIICIFGMIALVFLGLIPKKLPACGNNERVLSILNCFSAGIFLAMSLVHIMPESSETFSRWAQKAEIERPFPLPYVCNFLGYLFILFLDRVLASIFTGYYNDRKSRATVAVEVNTEEPKKGEAAAVERATDKENGSEAAPAPAENDEVKEEDQSKIDVSAITQKDLVDEDEAKDTILEEKSATTETVSKTAGIVLAVALGFHAFFEGIAFGLMPDVTQAVQLTFGIAIHKSAAAISLGGAFSRTGYTFCQIALFLSIFSISAPIGVIIGMLVKDSNPLIDVIILSITGGTFLYVACSEIVVHEFDASGNKWVKTLSVLLGGTLITCLWFFGEHSHEE